MKKLVWFALVFWGAWLVLPAQVIDPIKVSKNQEKPKLGIPDFRGAADAQKFMGAFNQTLWDDVKGSGLFDLVAKTSYPTFVPQQPSDFQTPAPSGPQARGGGK